MSVGTTGTASGHNRDSLDTHNRAQPRTTAHNRAQPRTTAHNRAQPAQQGHNRDSLDYTVGEDADIPSTQMITVAWPHRGARDRSGAGSRCERNRFRIKRLSIAGAVTEAVPVSARSQSPVIAASRKIAANIVFGTLSARATTERDLPSPARIARIDHTHPAMDAAHDAGGTSLTIWGGNGTAVRYEK